MSNKVKKIKENIENNEKIKQYYAESSLAGSAILTIAKMSHKTEKEALDAFWQLKDNFPKVNNVKEMCDYLIDYFGMKESYKDTLVLIYDDNNVYTPIVTACIECSTGPIYLPISSSGLYPAIMRNINEDNIVVEYIYNDSEDANENETEDNYADDQRVA